MTEQVEMMEKLADSVIDSATEDGGYLTCRNERDTNA